MREEEIADASLELVDLVVAVLDGEDVVVVGLDGGGAQAGELEVGLNLVLIVGVGSRGAPIEASAIGEEAKGFDLR